MQMGYFLNLFSKTKIRNSIFRAFVSLLVFPYLLFPNFSLLISIPVAEAASGVPKIISYQGRLLDSSGSLLGGTGTTFYFKFSIWNNSTVGSGTQLWPSVAPISSGLSVVQGVFNANIGDTANGFP